MHTTWAHDGEGQAYAPLTEDLRTDVVVIGGGLTGVLCAHLLTEAGHDVVLLERGHLGHGATAATTAFLTQAIDTGLGDLVAMFGPDGARKVWQSGAVAIAELEAIAAKYGVDCEFIRCSAYLYAKDPGEYEQLKEEADVAHRLDLRVSLKQDDALRFPNAGYLEVPNQAKFHPMAFVHRLAARAVQGGARIHERTDVVGLSTQGSVTVMTASGHTVRARDAIVATHLPFNKPSATRFKKGTYTSYAMEAVLKDTDIPEAIFWDLHKPYDYFRVDRLKNEVRIIAGGSDHRRELPVSTKKSFAAIEAYLKTVLGETSYRVVRRWSGHIVEPSDGLPLIGAYAPHRYLATGFSGNGMTFATVSALMFRDLIADRDNPWTALYDPTRSVLHPRRLWTKGRDYIKEFFGGAVRNTFR